MRRALSRRDALIRLGGAGAASLLDAGTIRGATTDIVVAGRPVEIAVASVSPATVRITVRPLDGGRAVDVPVTGELVEQAIGTTVARDRSVRGVSRVRAGDLVVRFSDGPPTLYIETKTGAVVQRLTLDAKDAGMSFLLGRGPLLGLGEGGPQFDRKGSADPMIIGQRGYRLATHGGRAPIQWLVGTEGWGMFIHQPYGSLVVYPGANRVSSWYEDDGKSFEHRRGDWMRVQIEWNEASRRLVLRLMPGSRMRAPASRRIVVRVAGSSKTSSLVFSGRPIELVVA